MLGSTAATDLPAQGEDVVTAALKRRKGCCLWRKLCCSMAQCRHLPSDGIILCLCRRNTSKVYLQLIALCDRLASATCVRSAWDQTALCMLS